MMKYTVFIVIAFVIFMTGSSSSFAQGGSNYSIFGIGDIDNSVGACYDGLAQTSIAFPSEHGVNLENPAMWTGVTSTRFSIGYMFNQAYVQSDQSQIWQNNGFFNNVSAVFSIDTSLGATFGFGLKPYSRVAYFVAGKTSSKVDDITIVGRNTFGGKGGLSQFHVGGSIKPIDNLSIGIMGYGIFGTIEHMIKTTFDDARHTAYANRRTLQSYKGLGLKLGMAYKYDGLTLGFFYDKSIELDIQELQRSENPFGNKKLYHEERDSYKRDLAARFGFGASYLTGKFIIGADYSNQNYKDLDIHLPSGVEFQALNSFSIGVERIGSKNRGTNYLDKVGYKFGLGLKQQYYKVHGSSINEMYAAVGMKVPVTNSTLLDAAFSFGQKGTLGNDLVKEYFGRFTFSISIGETWFKPFKRNY